MGTLTVFSVTGIPEVEPGDDIASLILGTGLGGAGSDLGLIDGDIVVVTHKIVSKAEGRIVILEGDADQSHRDLVHQESADVLRRRGEMIISRTRHGFVCANAGVDRSNTAPGTAILLPVDPDLSARRILTRLRLAYPVRMAVIVSDTFGRPWRRGLTDVAIGVAGMMPITDLRGTLDHFGNSLEVTEVSIADEVAAAADLVMGKSKKVPVAIVRGVEWLEGEGSIAATIRPASEDLFR